MTVHRHESSISRRTALAGIGAGGLGLAMHAGSGMAAQEHAIDYSDHPLTGVWLAMANPPLPDSPQVAAPSYFGADGFVLLVFPVSQAGPNGVQFNSPYAGVWEPHDEQTGHFTATQMISDANGTYLGTVTVDGFPHVSDDGQTFIDDGSLVTVTIRDPFGALVDQFPGPGAAQSPVSSWPGARAVSRGWERRPRVEGRPRTGVRSGRPSASRHPGIPARASQARSWPGSATPHRKPT